MLVTEYTIKTILNEDLYSYTNRVNLNTKNENSN